MKLSDRIDETREDWSSCLGSCRNELLDTIRVPQNPLSRLVVEFDYLLVEAKLALKALEAKLETILCLECEKNMLECKCDG